jgi:hypothetical protein
LVVQVLGLNLAEFGAVLASAVSFTQLLLAVVDIEGLTIRDMALKLTDHIHHILFIFRLVLSIRDIRPLGAGSGLAR